MSSFLQIKSFILTRFRPYEVFFYMWKNKTLERVAVSIGLWSLLPHESKFVLKKSWDCDWDCVLFQEFLKINKNIFLIFKFGKIHVPESNIDVNEIEQTIEKDQCVLEYPKKTTTEKWNWRI